MIDLSDVTFCIPIKLDSDIRKVNFKHCLTWLNGFKTNINVYTLNFSLDSLIHIKGNTNLNINTHLDKTSKFFHRTKFLNELVKSSKTPIIVLMDCDVFFNYHQFELAVNEIRSGKVDFCYPYDGLFLNIKQDTVESNIKNGGEDLLYRLSSFENYGKNSVGGAVIWNKTSFIKSGMENENFISWGYEDWERKMRAETLGYKSSRVNGPLFHMDHPRGPDSSAENPFYVQNGREYNKIAKMNKLELEKYIQTSFNWLK